MSLAAAVQGFKDDMAREYPEAESYRDAVRKYRQTGMVHRVRSGRLVVKVRGHEPPAQERFRSMTDDEYSELQSVRQQLRWAKRRLEEGGDDPGDAARVAQLQATLDGLALPLRRPFTVVVGERDPAARRP